jgi:hypothetical protein
MYTPSRIHKKISIYTIMEPSTETNTPVELVPVAEPVYVQEPVVETPEPVVETPEPMPEPMPEPVSEPPEPVPEPVVETPEPASEVMPEPVVEPVPEPVVETPEPVSEVMPEPVVEIPEPMSAPACDPVVERHEHVIELSDYTTPEYLEMVKKLIEKPQVEIEVNEPRKTFKIPGYTSIQMSNTSKQPRRKSMTFV